MREQEYSHSIYETCSHAKIENSSWPDILRDKLFYLMTLRGTHSVWRLCESLLRSTDFFALVNYFQPYVGKKKTIQERSVHLLCKCRHFTTWKLILQVKYVQKKQRGLKTLFNCICALSVSYVAQSQ